MSDVLVTDAHNEFTLSDGRVRIPLLIELEDGSPCPLQGNWTRVEWGLLDNASLRWRNEIIDVGCCMLPACHRCGITSRSMA